MHYEEWHMRKLTLNTMIVFLMHISWWTFLVAPIVQADENIHSITLPIASLIKEEKTLTGHSAHIPSISFSSDGKLIASAGFDHKVILWDAETGNMIKTLSGHKEREVLFVQISPDNKMLASAGGYGDNTIAIWDIDTGRKIKTIPCKTEESGHYVFSRDWKWLAYDGRDDQVFLVDIATGEQMRVWNGPHTAFPTGTSFQPYNYTNVSSIFFSSDGKYLTIRRVIPKEGWKDKNRLVVYDIHSQRIIHTIDSYPCDGVTFALSPVKSTLGACFSSWTYYLFDIATRGTIRQIKSGLGFEPNYATFSPDGSLLASIAYNDGKKDLAIDVASVATGELLRQYKNDKADSTSNIHFSPDGQIIAFKNTYNDFLLWHVKTGKQIPIKAADAAVNHILDVVAFSPDGKNLAFVGSDNKIHLWNILGATLPNFVKKGEFESTKEYQERLEKWEYPYTLPVTLGKYDADRGGFQADIAGNKVLIAVPRDKAVEFSSRNEKVFIEGKLKYFDNDKVQLVGAYLVDENSGTRYAVQKSIEGTAVAYTPKPVVEKKIVENIYDIPDFKAASRDNDFAVIIGIENYQQLPKSDFSKSDAGIVKDYIKALGFPERNIEYVTNEKATLSGISKTVEAWLPNRVKKDSTIFIYFSGHGSPDPSTGEAYIVPYDGDPNYLSITGYPLKRLYDKLGKLEAKDIIVVLDSCFSGAGGRSVLAKGARPLVMTTSSMTVPKDMAILSATQGSQISTSSPEKGHGIFTYYFLKALKDGKKTIAEIYESIKPLVEDEAKKLNVQQSPSLNPAPEKLTGRFNLRK